MGQQSYCQFNQCFFFVTLLCVVLTARQRALFCIGLRKPQESSNAASDAATESEEEDRFFMSSLQFSFIGGALHEQMTDDPLTHHAVCCLNCMYHQHTQITRHIERIFSTQTESTYKLDASYLARDLPVSITILIQIKKTLRIFNYSVNVMFCRLQLFYQNLVEGELVCMRSEIGQPRVMSFI